MVDWSAPEARAEALDDAFAFFQNCFALRDWFIAADVTSDEAMAALFRASRPVSVCRDLCNATKHYDLSRPSLRGFAVGRQYRGQPFVVFEDRDGRQDLLELLPLADACMAAWESFLASFERSGSSASQVDTE
ncbi:MAG TPA: hypothetical protein VN754_09145 [Candidatus Binataceae bacterium]|nr:hypothetical protein [Candidatus Binataceae bacterium]